MAENAEQVIVAAMTEHEPPITGLADEYDCCAEKIAAALREAGLLAEGERTTRVEYGIWPGSSIDVFDTLQEARREAGDSEAPWQRTVIEIRSPWVEVSEESR